MKVGQRLLRHFNFVLRRRIRGRSIRIPVLGGLKVGLSGEPFLFDLLERYLPSVDVLCDCGRDSGGTLIIA